MEIKLTSREKDFWNENSYLVIRGFLRNQIKDISKWVEETTRWPEDMSRYLHFYEMEEPSSLSRIENFVPFHTKLGQVLQSEEVIDLVSELMGQQAILYKDRINFKPAGGGAHSAHQDGVAYESGSVGAFEKDSTPYISVLISVDKATRENGCFEVAQGWNLDKLDILEMECPIPEHPNFSKISKSIEDEMEWAPIETEPGDLILFTERLPHRSASNNSEFGRRILYGVYNPISLGDKREEYYLQKKRKPNDPRYMVGNPHAPV